MPVAIVGIVPVIETLSLSPSPFALLAEVVLPERDDQSSEGFGGDVDLGSRGVDQLSPRLWTSFGHLEVEVVLSRTQLFFVEELSVDVAAGLPNSADVFGVLGKVLLKFLCCKALLAAVLPDDSVRYDGGKAANEDGRGIVGCLLTLVKRHRCRIFDAGVVVGSVEAKMVDAINAYLM